MEEQHTIPRPVPEALSVWALVGNIVGEHPAGPEGREARHGTRLFRPGSKVYLASLRHAWTLPPAESPKRERVEVIGRRRQTRAWVHCWVRLRYTTNWRVQLVYEPAALAQLRRAGWPGFWLQRGQFDWPAEERGSGAAVRALVEVLRAADERSREERRRAERAARPWWRFW
jgi:hypothetical protein